MPPTLPRIGALIPPHLRKSVFSNAHPRKVLDGALSGAPGHLGIVGAGLAGLFAARTLQDHGVKVSVFDKGWRPGGRCATRQSQEDPGLQFDHGAQYFTLRSDPFSHLGASWQEAGVISPWGLNLAQIEAPGAWEIKEEGPTRFVGTPGMRSLPEHLARGLDALHLHTTIARITPSQTGFLLEDAQGQQAGPFDALILNLPPAQAATLLEPVHREFFLLLQGLEMEPCWAAMVEFGAPVSLPFDAAFVNLKGGALGWVARQESKPGRPEGRQTWVLHASASWSRAHLEHQKEAIAPLLLHDFALAVGTELPSVAHLTAHRWRHSKPPDGQDPCPQAKHFWDAQARIGLCGDWCGGGRVEGALLSGRAMARRVLEHWGVGAQRA